MEKINLNEYLASNEYPGRGAVGNMDPQLVVPQHLFNGFDLPLAGAVLHYDNHRRIPSFRFSFSAAAFLRRRRWADSYEFQVRLVLGRIRSWR